MSDPIWLPAFDRTRVGTAEDHMRLAVSIALESALHGGGPFGAVVADPEGRVVDAGWNQVISQHDSTAHAEIVAMRRAQARARTHRLEGHVLYSSCAPCIQCYGAIYWSGLQRVYAAARKADAEAIGFDEGPIMTDLWAHAREARGIAYVPEFLRDEHALAPLRAYREAGSVDYSHH